MPKPFDDQVTLEIQHACDEEGLRSEVLANIVDKGGKRHKLNVDESKLEGLRFGQKVHIRGSQNDGSDEVNADEITPA